MGRIFGLLLLAALTACGSAPDGGSFAATDLNKYGNNYAAFPTDKLRVGMPFSAASEAFPKMTKIAADTGGETFSVERWASVAGPDYVDERLYLRFSGGKLANWKVEKAGPTSVAVVPNSW
jgi:hypothetical protein